MRTGKKDLGKGEGKEEDKIEWCVCVCMIIAKQTPGFWMLTKPSKYIFKYTNKDIL